MLVTVTPPMQRSPHVLAVDDDELVLSALARVLRHAGYAVTSASGVAQAVAALEGRRFDVVVTDLCMPGGGAAEVVRAVAGACPVVVVTGLDVELDQVAGEAFALLHKPFRCGELLEVLKRALASG